MNATSSAVLEAAAPASPPVPRVEPARRFYELDLLRFLAAFSVMLFHYSFRGSAADGLSPIAYESLAPITKYGGLGVNLFFLISGFVILMSAGQGSARTFVISRVVRLYPAFWVCCTVTFFALRLAPHPRFVPTVGRYLENLTMLNGFVNESFIDSVYWSLTVEMQFYFMVFLALKLRLIGRTKEILGIWLAAYAACALLHIRYLPILLIPSYAPYFVGGAMFFLIAREGVSPYKLAVVGASFALAAWQ
jgi:peptidoglycan/LPS O-acetylase OafA/YrhL